MYRRK
jgi:hypothetical protein